MSSDEEDIDLNDENTSLLETATDDGGESMDIEGNVLLMRLKRVKRKDSPLSPMLLKILFPLSYPII